MIVVTVVVRLPDGAMFNYADTVQDYSCAADAHFPNLDDDAFEIAHNLLQLPDGEDEQLVSALRLLDTSVAGHLNLTGGVQVLILHNPCEFRS